MQENVFNTVKLPDNLLEAVQEYVNAFDFSYLGQDDASRIARERQYLFIEKAIEWTAYKKIKELGVEASKPDMSTENLADRAKSLGVKLPDTHLFAKGSRKRYKTDNSEEYWTPEWFVDYSEEQGFGVIDKVIFEKSKQNVVAFGTLDKQGEDFYGQIHAIVEVGKLYRGTLKQSFLREPSLPSQKHEKRVISFGDLVLFQMENLVPDVIATNNTDDWS